MSYSKMFAGAVIAGCLIACAGAASTLAAANFPFLKAFIFPIGLLLICYGKFQLFTGNVYKIGRDSTLDEDDKLGLLTVNYIGNLVGAFLVSRVVRVPFEAAFLAKFALGPWPLLLLAIACNMLVCYGVKRFQNNPLITYMCVFLFVACGFEHSIADMYYFFCLPPYYWFGGLLMLVIITVGNIIGGWLVIKLERMLET